MRRAIVLFVFAFCLAAQQASIEGLAVNALTGEPLSGVHVRLITGTFGGITSAYGAISDRAGHFSIATIRPGTYILAPDRNGYLYIHSKEANAAIPSLSLKPGEQLKGYKLEMTPRAVLSGKVVDENGDPVQGVSVKAVPVPPATEPLMLMPMPNSNTDDRGEFRIITAPGRYHVQANPPGGPMNQNPERRNDGSAAPTYGVTFYPSSIAKDRATAVEAIGGKDVGGLEIRLARQQGLAITGTVSGITEDAGRAFVILQSGDSPQQMRSSRSFQVGPDGKFTAPGLQPGYYRVSAHTQGGKAMFTSQPVDLRLDTADPPPVSLTLSSGADLSGTLVIEGDAPGTPAEKRTVRLAPATPGGFNMMQPKGGETDGGNSFRLEGVGPGKYRLSITPLPENAYVKTVEVDGAPAPDDLIEVAGGTRGARVKVVINRNGAQLSGRVLDPNGERLLTPLAMVLLMKDDTDLPAEQSTSRVTPDGKYTLKGVRPGKYRLFAVDVFSMGNQSGPDVFKRIFPNGEEIEIKEGDRIAKDVRVLSKEVVNAKPKQ